MKTKWIVIAAVLLIGTASVAMIGKGPEVPQVVQDAFAQKYPDAKKVKWEAEDGEYEAEFKQGGQEMSATFAAAGTWLETESEIKKAALPAAVRNAIASAYPDYEIEEAEQVETPELPMGYEVELEQKKGGKTIEAVYRPDGTLVKAKEEMEDDDDND